MVCQCIMFRNRYTNFNLITESFICLLLFLNDTLTAVFQGFNSICTAKKLPTYAKHDSRDALDAFSGDISMYYVLYTIT